MSSKNNQYKKVTKKFYKKNLYSEERVVQFLNDNFSDDRYHVVSITQNNSVFIIFYYEEISTPETDNIKKI